MSQADDFLRLFDDPPRAEALALILAERIRQETKEGFDNSHDDEHIHGELAAAAGCYAIFAAAKTPGVPDHARGLAHAATQDCWPWDWTWWKPADADRCLVKAGALILAELERRARLRGSGATPQPGAKRNQCRHYDVEAIFDRPGWLLCKNPECGREYQPERPNVTRRSER